MRILLLNPNTSAAMTERMARAAQAALAAGSRLAALGTAPLAVEPTLSSSERYREMGRRFGLTVSEELTCGCHVHVAVDSDDEHGDLDTDDDDEDDDEDEDVDEEDGEEGETGEATE